MKMRLLNVNKKKKTDWQIARQKFQGRQNPRKKEGRVRVVMSQTQKKKHRKLIDGVN